jgi:hypothetical protein
MSSSRDAWPNTQQADRTPKAVTQETWSLLPHQFSAKFHILLDTSRCVFIPCHVHKEHWGAFVQQLLLLF